MEERERDSTALKSLGDECCAFSHATLTGSNDRQPQTTSEITRRSIVVGCCLCTTIVCLER
jgi:hypothetical protein